MLFVTNQVYAPCIEGPGINCNNYPPPSLSQIKTDKLNYEISDKPIITIMGAPDAVAHLEIDDSSSNIMLFTHDISLAPNGTARYVLDILSYKPGVYSAIVTSPISKLTTNFAVGLSTTGSIITLNVLKDTYVQGDFITIVGTVGRNDTVQLSLIDPNDNVVTSIQTVSNDVGQYSTSALRIPTNAISGIWKITADHNVSHTAIKITVQSYASNGVMKSTGPVVVTLESPLKQFKSGTDPYFVICNQNLQLVIKSSDNSPACVRSSSIERLLKQGWVDAYDNNGKYLPMILPNMIKVQNTNFTINYNITGNNKLLDANMDSQSKSLILSLNATNNGTLIVSLPREMIDAKLPTGNDDKFYILVNGQESVFKEINTTTNDRTISISFTNGTHVIEIIGVQII
jgi:hypothetical protein